MMRSSINLKFHGMSFLTLLLFTAASITCVVCETFTIVPSNESSCPEDICYTLDQFAFNFSLPSEDGGFENITLALQPGSHTLEVCLILRNMTRFEMRGVNVSCTVNSTLFDIEDTQFVYFGGINFTINSQLTVINAKELTIENCSMESNESFQILSTDSVLIINSYFVRSSSTIFDVQRSTMVVRDSVFAGNIASLQRFQGLISSDDSSVTIENCVFANNLVNSSFVGLLFLSSFGAREDLVIVNSTFVNNSAGGGLVNGLLSFFESVVIYGCTFSNNIVENQTGAVVVRGQSVEITHITFDSNSVDDFSGQALDVSADRGSIQNCTFNNSSTGSGAASVRVETVNSSFSVQQNRFINNDSFGSGGGLSLRGDSCRLLIVRQNQFTNNSVHGGAGGALFMSLGRNCCMVLVENNIFTTNSASSGGAVHYRESTLQTVPNNLSTDVLITDNVFISNSASSCGSAIAGVNSRFSTQTSLQPTYRLTLDSNVFSTSGEVAGTLLCFSDGNITIRNSSFIQNSGSFNGRSSTSY